VPRRSGCELTLNDGGLTDRLLPQENDQHQTFTNRDPRRWPPRSPGSLTGRPFSGRGPTRQHGQQARSRLALRSVTLIGNADRQQQRDGAYLAELLHWTSADLGRTGAGVPPSAFGVTAEAGHAAEFPLRDFGAGGTTA